MTKVLLVEDEAPKRKKLEQFVGEHLPNADVLVARSVRAAIDILRVQNPDVILLDMSLPTFDIAEDESGGRPQGFGGIEVMRFLDRAQLSANVIVVTAYEAFAENDRKVDLDSLSKQLKRDHPKNFKALVYYNTVLGNWIPELQEALKKVV
jgi:CheY-like chemotaxis protein